MKNLGYYNGKYDEIEKMQIPMLDRVCWFGDGVYDATYAHNHIVLIWMRTLQDFTIPQNFSV